MTSWQRWSRDQDILAEQVWLAMSGSKTQTPKPSSPVKAKLAQPVKAKLVKAPRRWHLTVMACAIPVVLIVLPLVAVGR